MRTAPGTPVHREAPRGLLPRLTAVRGPATLTVVLFHTVDNLVGNRLWSLPGTAALLANADVMLSLFFVLSGFVLALGWRSGADRRAFFVRRVARIYPLYALAWVLAVGVDLWRQGTLPDPGVALATLLLVQSLVPSEAYVFGVNLVFWSLSCEAIFYLALPFVLDRIWTWGDRRLVALLGACAGWLVVVPLVVQRLRGEDALTFVVHSPLYRWSEFLAGAVVCLLVRRGYRPPLGARGSVLVFLAGFLVSSLVVDVLLDRGASTTQARLVGMVLCGPAVLLLVAGLARSDLAGTPPTRLSGPTGVRLGDWTYAAYLVHFPLVLALFERPLTRADGPAGWAQLLLYLGLVTALSAVLHERVLRPAERAIRARWLPRARPGTGPNG